MGLTVTGLRASGMGTGGSLRVCSLLPGATEVVAALGMADRLVGISHECDYPPEILDKPVLVRAAVEHERAVSREIDRQVKDLVEQGESLYAMDELRFVQAEPTVVITQELCQVCAITPRHLDRALAALPQAPAVVSLNPTSLEQVLGDILTIGKALERVREARTLMDNLRARLQTIRDLTASIPARPRVACLDWLDPFYCAGHWVPEMVSIAGGTDALGQPDRPSRPLTWDELVAASPDVVVLMPCGFSAPRTAREVEPLLHRYDWDVLPAVRSQKVFAVDAASYFSRPGPRLVEGVAILAALLHPDAAGEPSPQGAEVIPIPARRLAGESP